MTALGAVLAAAVLVVLIWSPRRFPWVLAAAAAFPDSAAIVVSGSGLSCYHAAAAVAVGRLGYMLLRRRSRVRSLSRLGRLERALLIGLAAYSLAVTAVGPTLFHGVPVLTPRLGIDAQVTAMTPLTYTVSNVAQGLYLVLNLGVVAYLAVERSVTPRLIEVTIAIAGIGSLVAGALGPFWPAGLFDTMDFRYVTGMNRLRGIFSEPSLLGLVLAGAIAYCVVAALQARGRRLVWSLTLLTVLCIDAALNRSGTLAVALAAWAVLTVAFLVVMWVVRSPRPFRITVVSVVIVVTVAFACTPLFRTLADALTGDKVGSLSYRNRTAADARGFGILQDSWGLGTGLGSNRSSSLLATALSTIGVPGTLLLVAVIVVALLRGLRGPRAALPLVSALVAVGAAHASSIPDLSFPMLWVLLGLVLATRDGWTEPPGHVGRREAPVGIQRNRGRGSHRGKDTRSEEAAAASPLLGTGD